MQGMHVRSWQVIPALYLEVLCVFVSSVCDILYYCLCLVFVIYCTIVCV